MLNKVVKMTIEARSDAPHYPLGDLSDLLYEVCDFLTDRQSGIDVDFESVLPINQRFTSDDGRLKLKIVVE